ncbi:MAG: hypothetical protein KDI60_18825 [Xanthomonadales bacterium]|nr:hypothetical protein [Xanthomonadales bacterium]MCB1613785.1 hypothetical protein [Xanthomonadales bacterium]
MSNYLASLAEQRCHLSADEILWEVAEAFDESEPESSAHRHPRALELRELVRFCTQDSIAPWLRGERDALHRALRFARKIGADDVAALLSSALDGVPQADAVFTVGMKGQKPEILTVTPDDATMFDGKDWGSTDIALSLAMDDFCEAVVDELVAAKDTFSLDVPRARRQRETADARIKASAIQDSAAALFKRLITAPNPRVLAANAEDAERGLTHRALTLPVMHIAYAGISDDTVAELRRKHGTAADELLSVYQRHNGAELFQFEGESGFCLAPEREWPELLAQAIDWAETVTWQDATDEIPAYLYTAIAFGYIPGDSERWLLITEGQHAGKIMLSDTDLIEDQPRFESFSQFAATLLNDAGRVIGSGGYIRYLVGEDELYPIRLSDD